MIPYRRLYLLPSAHLASSAGYWTDWESCSIREDTPSVSPLVDAYRVRGVARVVQLRVSERARGHHDERELGFKRGLRWSTPGRGVGGGVVVFTQDRNCMAP